MQRFRDDAASFEEQGLQFVAISADTVPEAAKMREKHGLDFPILSDESLDVTRSYNLLHERNITPTRGYVRPLPVPATILIDADGIVRWIDRADDFRSRTHPDEVFDAVRTALRAT